MWNKDFRAGYNYIKEVERREKMNRIKQSLLGVAVIAVGIISVPVLEGDITGAILTSIIGIGLIVSTEVFVGQ